MNEKKGKQSIKFGNPPYILGAAAVAGPKEIDGPMARYFDRVSEDATFGKDSWEEGESEMVRQAVTLAIQKAGIVKQDIRYIFAGDLLGQLIASTFGIKDMEIPVFGLYGACSTCGEALSLASMTVAAGYADNVIAEGVKPLWKCGEAVPFSLGIWKSASPVSYLDGHGKWCLCGVRQRVGCVYPGRNHRADSGLWCEGFPQHGSVHGTSGGCRYISESSGLWNKAHILRQDNNR